MISFMAPGHRITPERVRTFINHISTETRASSVALVAHNLYQAARLIAPTADWAWLGSLKSRLLSRAHPEDRFDRLVAAWRTLDFGIELMDEALKLPISRPQATRDPIS